MEKVFEIYIRTTPERLWEAITDPVIRTKYQFGAWIESDWTADSPYRLGHPAQDLAVSLRFPAIAGCYAVPRRG